MLNSFQIVGKLIRIDQNNITMEVPIFPGNGAYQLTTMVDPKIIADMADLFHDGASQMIAISGQIVPNNGGIALAVKEVAMMTLPGSVMPVTHAGALS
ncbi:MAG: hypothetical protein IJI66_01915 [Erysipelotrichaceae bacterium]|nr:hypothetical protein [Erysipelotrichaceae bacterium]